MVQLLILQKKVETLQATVAEANIDELSREAHRYFKRNQGYILIHTHTYSYMLIHTHTYAYILMHTHAYIYSHIHAALTFLVAVDGSKTADMAFKTIVSRRRRNDNVLVYHSFHPKSQDSKPHNHKMEAVKLQYEAALISSIPTKHFYLCIDELKRTDDNRLFSQNQFPSSSSSSSPSSSPSTSTSTSTSFSSSSSSSSSSS